MQSKRRKTWGRRFTATLCISYLGSYLYFSLNGQFLIANHGGPDYSREWSPKYLVIDSTFGHSRPKRAFTRLGYLYLPCILLDRLLWHPGPSKYLPGKVIYHEDVSDWPSYQDGSGTHWAKENVVYTDNDGDGIIDVRVETRDVGQIISIRWNNTGPYFSEEMHSSDHPRVNSRSAGRPPVPTISKPDNTTNN